MQTWQLWCMELIFFFFEKQNHQSKGRTGKEFSQRHWSLAPNLPAQESSTDTANKRSAIRRNSGESDGLKAPDVVYFFFLAARVDRVKNAMLVYPTISQKWSYPTNPVDMCKG